MLIRALSLSAIAIVACSCRAAPEESPRTSAPVSAEPVAEAPQQVVEGPCATACRQIIAGICDWQSPCSGEGFPYVPVCDGQPISCSAAEVAAAEPNAYGLEFCYRECEGLR